MNKIHLNQKEILEKFDEKYKEVWNSELSKFVRIPEGIKGNMLRDISDALYSQVEVIKGMIEKKSDIRVAKADGSAEENFDYGYDVKTNEVLDLLTIHEDKTP